MQVIEAQYLDHWCLTITSISNMSAQFIVWLSRITMQI
jgi:hypothetical protein